MLVSERNKNSLIKPTHSVFPNSIFKKSLESTWVVDILVMKFRPRISNFEQTSYKNYVHLVFQSLTANLSI